MSRSTLICSTALALLVPLRAMAADKADLHVTGSIFPASCDVQLNGRDTVDLGPIRVGTFVPGEDRKLPETAAFMTIDCQGSPAKFRMKAIDSSGSTVSTAGSDHYGLGMNGDNPIGYFTLSFAGDIMPGDFFILKSTDGGAGDVWATPVHGKVPFDHDGEAFAFAKSATATEPADLRAIGVPLSIQAVLAKDPVVNNDVPLTGQVTMELIY